MSAILLLGLIAATSSRLASPLASPLAVDVTGDCPSADAVAAALGSALGKETRTGVADVPRVSDQGDRFSVAALGQIRQYADPARDCDERARAAAVFIALALNPPVSPAAPEPAIRSGAAQQVAVVPPPAAPARESERWIDLGAAARIDGGPAPAPGPAIGFEARVAVGWRWLGVAASAGVLAPTESKFSSDTVTVRQQRFPLSIGLTARREIAQRLALAGVAGAALVPLTLRGEALDGGSQATRLDAGVRLAFELRFRATRRLAPFLDLHVEVFPRAYQIDVAPLGTVGSTGRFWVGVSAGLSFEAMPAKARQ